MATQTLSLQEAAQFSDKSLQTIRRAVKAKKIKFTRKKTPQGFNYLIDKASLCKYYGVEVKEETKKPEIKELKAEETKVKAVKKEETSKSFVTTEDLGSLTRALERMVGQHADERQNFLRLVNSLNDKVFALENQLNLLSAPKKSWFKIWK